MLERFCAHGRRPRRIAEPQGRPRTGCRPNQCGPSRDRSCATTALRARIVLPDLVIQTGPSGTAARSPPGRTHGPGRRAQCARRYNVKGRLSGDGLGALPTHSPAQGAGQGWSGGIGRRTGLKIQRPSLGMRVRPPPPAPNPNRPGRPATHEAVGRDDEMMNAQSWPFHLSSGDAAETPENDVALVMDVEALLTAIGVFALATALDDDARTVFHGCIRRTIKVI